MNAYVIKNNEGLYFYKFLFGVPHFVEFLPASAIWHNKYDVEEFFNIHKVSLEDCKIVNLEIREVEE